MHRFCPLCGHRVDAELPYECGECGSWQWANPKPCAGALIERDGSVLLLRRAFEPWYGHWDFPGGFCDPGEHPADTARREVLEETGLRVAIGDLLGIWMDVYTSASDPDDQRITTTNVYYSARIIGDGRIELDASEALEARWFTRDETPEPLGFPRHFPELYEVWRSRD